MKQNFLCLLIIWRAASVFRPRQ